jgi:FkbM family methyltransferase
LFRGQTAICRYDNDLKIKLDLDEWIQQHVYFLGTWDEPASNFLRKHLKEGDFFFDIGANIGCFTLLASKLVGEKGRVVAFEPVQEIFERLRNNVEMNKLSNVILNAKAVYESNASLELILSDRSNLGMSSIFHHDTEDGRVERVEAVSLDSYVSISGLKRVDMIKIDVEGAELFVLRGMKEVLRNYRPVVIMEISDEVIKSSQIGAEELIDIMRNVGYEVKGIDRKGNVVDSGPEPGYTNSVFFPLVC